MKGTRVGLDLKSILIMEKGSSVEEKVENLERHLPVRYIHSLNRICAQVHLNSPVRLMAEMPKDMIRGKKRKGTPILLAIAYEPDIGEICVNYIFGRMLVDLYKAGERGGVATLLHHEDGHAYRHSLIKSKNRHFYLSDEEYDDEERFAFEYAGKLSKNPVDDYASSVAILAARREIVKGIPAEAWISTLFKLHGIDKYLDKGTVKAVEKCVWENLPRIKKLTYRSYKRIIGDR